MSPFFDKFWAQMLRKNQNINQPNFLNCTVLRRLPHMEKQVLLTQHVINRKVKKN